VFRHEITYWKEPLIGHRWTPGLDVVATTDQSADLIVKRPFATSARQVVPDSDSHDLTVKLSA